MAGQLRVTVGHRSNRGAKKTNQDFHGVCVPTGARLRAKGVAVALADGIGSSDVSHIASETAVGAFLADYYCTSEAWSTKTSGHRVLAAVNAWLHAQTRQSRYRDDMDRGYVCTFSALVLKGTTAHLFHVGDARIYRLNGEGMEQLTEDHRVQVSREQSYLGRALGADTQVEVDYRALPVDAGDMFLLVTDGVHEHVDDAAMAAAVRTAGDNLDRVAEAIVAAAAENGSPDNLTAQLVRVDAVPDEAAGDVPHRLGGLPFPPDLAPRSVIDGYEIRRELHASSRSRVYLAWDRDSGQRVALKVPGSDVRQDPVLLERFLLEEWIARRLDNPHVVRPVAQARSRSYLYVVTEFIEGRSLGQWMVDHPAPGLETVRTLVEQIGKGLLAFHRQEMVHRDLRPANVLVDASGTARIIDFGAAEVAGIAESTVRLGADDVLGTEQYSAPEYFLGEGGSAQSDIFSLGVIAYQLLTGDLPYGTAVPQARSPAARNRLTYRSAVGRRPDLPLWVDGAIRRAVHPAPQRRYQDVAEFLFDLRHPRKAYLDATPPLMERHPARFWQGVSAVLGGVVLLLLWLLARA